MRFGLGDAIIGRKMVDGGGFEPPKAEPSDLQSDPFGRSGISPDQALPPGSVPLFWLSVCWAIRLFRPQTIEGPIPGAVHCWALGVSGMELAKGLEPPTCSLQNCCSAN